MQAAEPAAFRIESPQGKSPFLLICDHAGRHIPARLGTLGLAPADLDRHIAWDIGAAAVTLRLSHLLDAFAVLQNYSRLVIDCNRRPGSLASIVKESEATPIPGNQLLPPGEAERREREIFRPYHDRIGAELELRSARNRNSVVVAMHSFTPVFHGVPRPWHAAVLYNRDRRFALPLRDFWRRDAALIIGDNEPYALSDASDYSIPEHAERRGLLHVEIEIRQDLISQPAAQLQWAQRVAQGLLHAGQLFKLTPGEERQL
jgi:predicted N-formylglutamate amidohydrolase